MIVHRLLILPGLLTALAAAAEPVQRGDDAVEAWQLSVLFSPTPSQRARERAGRVYVYSGLSEDDVDRAMSLHFERIDSMMFVRTRLTDSAGNVLRDEAGEAITEDDGC